MKKLLAALLLVPVMAFAQPKTQAPLYLPTVSQAMTSMHSTRVSDHMMVMAYLQGIVQVSFKSGVACVPPGKDQVEVARFVLTTFYSSLSDNTPPTDGNDLLLFRVMDVLRAFYPCTTR